MEKSDIENLKSWATQRPDVGKAVYQLTSGDKDHKHTYHKFCPWSPDRSKLLLARYDRVNPEADICLMDVSTGEINKLSTTIEWETHASAFQQWLGCKNRIIFKVRKGEKTVLKLMDSDGSNEEILDLPDFDLQNTSTDGKKIYGTTAFLALFPDNEIGPRDEKGVLSYDVETGKLELLLSVEKTLALVPDAEKISHCHLFDKMLMVHQKSGRLMFNFTNTFWDRDGTEPRVRCLITCDADGGNPAYLGGVLHHPNWHTVEDKVIGNFKDCNNETRLGFYDGDGSGLLNYVPKTKGSGHPTMSPDGKWIFTDGRMGEVKNTMLIFCDPVTGDSIKAAEVDLVSAGYKSFKAIDNRKENETVADALKSLKHQPKVWQTQCHPAWSRDGSAIVFNADEGKGSQLFVIDVGALVNS
ncbi:MAG: TolB-like translocation protein [Planctomycetota bacterium]|jgi:hypothetical protein